MSDKTETVIYKYPLERNPLPQEVRPNDPLTEKIHGPLSVGHDPSGQLCVWCLVEKGERHIKERHIYLQLALTGGPLPGQEITFLSTVIDQAHVLHAFWWEVDNSQN